MKFKERAKGSLLGFIIGVIVTTSIPVIAAQIQKSIDVYYRDIKIYADGKLVNTNGDNEAFIYNGTTYLPVRAVGEAFNKAVNWDGKTSSVYLGIQPTTTGQPTVLLEDLDYFTSDMRFDTSLINSGKDNIGNTHNSGISIEGRRGSTEYLLNGKYRRFTGVIGVPYNYRNDKYEGIIKIYGDNKLLYTSPVMTAGVQPTNFNIDVTGVLNLKIEREDTYVGHYVCIYDAGFYS